VPSNTFVVAVPRNAEIGPVTTLTPQSSLKAVTVIAAKPSGTLALGLGFGWQGTVPKRKIGNKMDPCEKANGAMMFATTRPPADHSLVTRPAHNHLPALGLLPAFLSLWHKRNDVIRCELLQSEKLEPGLRCCDILLIHFHNTSNAY